MWPEPDAAPLAAAIIVAAGRGTRIGEPDKILMHLGRRPILAYSVDAAEAARSITDIVLVAGIHTKERVEQLVNAFGWKKVRHVVLGGERRQDSVEAGLGLVRPEVDVIVIHDGARPFAPPALFDACTSEAARTGAAIAAAPVTDTLKRSVGRNVGETIPRENIWAAQTPQAFRADLLRNAFAYAHERGLDVTDEAGILEAQDIAVRIVPSTPRNLKITTSDDLELAEALVAGPTERTRQ
jgi:2-C-methyl-D-erythritol 4-phosphate cytidylyltransferase